MTIKVNTRGYGGRKLDKSITVYTSDKKNYRIILKVTGDVEAYASIKPKKVRLKGDAGQEIKETVTIETRDKYPFHVLGAKARKGEFIKVNLEKFEKDRGGRYLLTIENTRTDEGNYYDTVVLNTDSKIQPEITIRVYGHIAGTKKG